MNSILIFFYSFKGTRNFEGQIAYGIHLSAAINIDIKNLIKQTDNHYVKHYIDEFIFKKTDKFAEGLIREESVQLSSLKHYEIKLMEHHLHTNSFLIRSSRAVNCKQEYHTFNYDAKFENIDNHSIEYYLDKVISYGTIVNFIKLDNQNFCIIKKMKKCVFKSVNKKLQFYIDKFFIELKETNEYALVKLNNIIRRCIRSTYKLDSIEHIIFSPCIDLTEHD